MLVFAPEEQPVYRLMVIRDNEAPMELFFIYNISIYKPEALTGLYNK